MGKIKFGFGVSEIRGKVGGSVYSKNHYGVYVKNFTSPTNTLTVYKTNIWGYFSIASSAWRSLTSTQRSAWRAARYDLPRNDVFGDRQFLTGYNLFVSCNVNRQLLGLALLSSPVVYNGVGTVIRITGFSASVSGGTFTSAFSPSPIPANVYYLVYATAPISLGRAVKDNSMRWVGNIAPGATSPVSLFAMWTSRFGALVAGKKIILKFVPVCSLCGVSGPEVYDGGNISA